MTVDKAAPNMNAVELKNKRYDSLFAPRGTKGIGTHYVTVN